MRLRVGVVGCAPPRNAQRKRCRRPTVRWACSVSVQWSRETNHTMGSVWSNRERPPIQERCGKKFHRKPEPQTQGNAVQPPCPPGVQPIAVGVCVVFKVTEDGHRRLAGVPGWKRRWGSQAGEMGGVSKVGCGVPQVVVWGKGVGNSARCGKVRWSISVSAKPRRRGSWRVCECRW